MNATNFGTNKDFRKTVDIRQKVRHGKIERKIYLPPEDFAYGLPNRPPTPFKDVIYNAFGNRAEDIIRNEYGNYIRERSVKNSRPPEVITRYINPKAEEYKMRDVERYIKIYEKLFKKKTLNKNKKFEESKNKVQLIKIDAEEAKEAEKEMDILTKAIVGKKRKRNYNEYLDNLKERYAKDEDDEGEIDDAEFEKIKSTLGKKSKTKSKSKSKGKKVISIESTKNSEIPLF